MKELMMFFTTALAVSVGVCVNGQEAGAIKGGIGEGIGWTTADSSMDFNFHFFVQSRADFLSMEHSSGRENQVNGRIQQFRLKFDGFLADPRLTYKLQLEMSEGKTLMGREGQNSGVLHEAILFYRFSDRFQLGMGQAILPGNRQRVNPLPNTQMMDRSLVNSVFHLDMDFGFHGEYEVFPERNHSLTLLGAVTTGEGRNWIEMTRGGLSWTGRVNWLPFGRFIRNSIYAEGDMEGHESPRLLLGAGYNFNDRAVRFNGQTGGRSVDPRDVETAFADFIFKYRGWSFLGEFMKRESKELVGAAPDGEEGFTFAGKGLNVQGGRYFSSGWEIAARYSEVSPDLRIQLLTPRQREITVGINKYFYGRLIRMQGDVTSYHHRLSGAPAVRGWGIRLQAQVGI